MSCLVEIALGVGVWVGHTRRVPSHDVEGGARGQAGLGVPLYLRRTYRDRVQCEYSTMETGAKSMTYLF